MVKTVFQEMVSYAVRTATMYTYSYLFIKKILNLVMFYNLEEGGHFIIYYQNKLIIAFIINGRDYIIFDI